MTRILKNQEKIKAAFDKYTEALNKTNSRRVLWTAETKIFLLETLTLIKETFPFDWAVQQIESIENFQAINLCCHAQPSGYIETLFDSTDKAIDKRSYVKYGGYLSYAQSYNGKINIFMEYPYIEEWVEQLEPQLFETLKPSEITEEKITQHVIKFLEMISQWEGTDRPHIGFKK